MQSTCTTANNEKAPEFDQCCYPIGEPRTPAFRYCAAPVAQPGAVYCTEHKRLCRLRLDVAE